MSEQQPPKIEFPCPDYPIKVIGDNAPDFRDYVVDTVRIYDPTFDESCVTTHESSKARYVSVRFNILATGEEQLDKLHKDLKASGRVYMVI